MTTPTAPAASAFAALIANAHAPRLMRAILPVATTVDQSVARQPRGSVGATRSAVTPPTGEFGENSIWSTSYAAEPGEFSVRVAVSMISRSNVNGSRSVRYPALRRVRST